MRVLGLICCLLLVSCYHDLKHEKYVRNMSADTITVVNPDFDTIIYVYPGMTSLIYSFEILDTKQESDDCKWLGDSLAITNQDDSICLKSPYIEENWSFEMKGTDKERVQVCTIEVDENDF